MLCGTCFKGTDNNPLTFSITKYVGFNFLIKSKNFINTTPLFSFIDNLFPAVLKAWHGGPPIIKSIFSFFFSPAAFLISFAEYLFMKKFRLNKLSKPHISIKGIKIITTVPKIFRVCLT